MRRDEEKSAMKRRKDAERNAERRKHAAGKRRDAERNAEKREVSEETNKCRNFSKQC